VPQRPTLPSDDLYARLEISVDASPEAVEVAWRALLRQHHPDIAGPSGLERSKRINVAHDWLSDPDLRSRYDHERGLRRSLRATGGRDPRDDGRAVRTEGRAARHAAVPRPSDPAEALAHFLDHVATLEPDEVDRLACAEPPPIAFGATIARFLPEDRLAALEAVEAAIATRLDPAVAAVPGVRDAIEGYATELVLGTFLDDLLTEPFRDRARERLTRGWDAAVGQPRYGPNGDAVRALLARLAALDRAGVAALAGTARRVGYGDGGSEDPWPPDTSPDDDEALRVSSILAARDAADTVPAGLADRATTARARWSAARLAHLLVLRHAFAPRAFASLTRPWRPRFLPDDRPAPRVQRPARG
jgi:curved DNA-binding protein CbpA